MKANEAPEKLYFGEYDKGILNIYSNKEPNDEIEYTRNDTLEAKEVDLEDEIKLNYNPVDGLEFEEYKRIAKYYFELRLKAQKGEKV